MNMARPRYRDLGEVLALYYKGRYQLAGTMTDIAAFIHAHTPRSLNHALKFEGWSIKPLGAKSNPCGLNMKHARRTAQANANYFGVPYVVFSDTSGNLRIERASIGPKNVPWKETFKPVRDRFARNPELPSAPAVESISVAAGSQPQQALMKSGYTVSKTEGGQATMLPPKANPRRKHMVEVVKASKVYGKHAGGWVTLVDGHIVLHGDKTDCMRIAERAGGANVVDGKRVKTPSARSASLRASGNPGFNASYRSLAYDRDLGAYAFKAPSLEKARDKAIEEGRQRGAWGCWLRAQGEPKGEHIVISAARRNPAPGENLLEQRTAFRRAVEMARKKGWDRVFVVFNQALGQFEILEHPPTMGRCWEVDLHEGTSGRATPHNNPGFNAKLFDRKYSRVRLLQDKMQAAYLKGGYGDLSQHPYQAEVRKLVREMDAMRYPKRNPGLSNKEEIALRRMALGGPEALRTKDYHVDSRTIASLMRKGYLDKKGLTEKGGKWVIGEAPGPISNPIPLPFSTDEPSLRKAFSWLTRIGAGRYFGNIPIGWYQAHQFAALEWLEMTGAESARLHRGRIQGKFGLEWRDLTSARELFDIADRKCRDSGIHPPLTEKGPRSNPGRYGTPMYRRHKSSARYSVKCPDCGVTVKRRLEDIPDDKRCAICSAKRRRLGANPSPRYKVIAEHADHYYTTWHSVTKRDALAQARKCASNDRGYDFIKVVAMTHPSDKPFLKLYKDGKQWKECSK